MTAIFDIILLLWFLGSTKVENEWSYEDSTKFRCGERGLAQQVKMRIMEERAIENGLQSKVFYNEKVFID